MAAITKIVTTAQIAACPKQSLLAGHYRDDGTCRCTPPRVTSVSPQVLPAQPTAEEVYEYTLDGLYEGEECGRTESPTGWFALVHWPVDGHWYIVSQDDLGFRYLAEYASEETARQDFGELQDQYYEWDDDGELSPATGKREKVRKWEVNWTSPAGTGARTALTACTRRRAAWRARGSTGTGRPGSAASARTGRKSAWSTPALTARSTRTRSSAS